MPPDSGNNFQTLQRSFAHFCRTNIPVELPGITSPERMQTYRNLVFSSVCSALEKAYPIAKAALGNNNWDLLVQEFFTNYPCKSPEFWKMPQGLCEYVQQSPGTLKDFPWLSDLLEFEWIEIEVYMMEDMVVPEATAVGDPMELAPIITPEHRLQQFQYPVFRLKPAELEDKNTLKSQKGSYFILTFRHPKTLQVRFLELSPLFILALEHVLTHRTTGRDALKKACERLGIDYTLKVEAAGKEFFSALKNEGAIVGYQETSL